MKYIVLKIEDIEKYCSFEQQEQLSDICNDIQGGRAGNGKAEENRYYVVNTDETYAKDIKDIIEKNEGEEVTFG